MKDEIDSLTQNKTWKLTKLPANCRPLRGKWVYKLKWGPTGEIARWVVRGSNNERVLITTKSVPRWSSQ